jgi:hypothetical protein
MSTSKHDKLDGPSPFPDDLERNPGIGASEGAFARTDIDPTAIEGVTTVEGDVENQATRDGAAAEGKLGRTNK